jgi:hypothetical protein
MSVRLDDIRTAIEQPDFVTRDWKYRHRENFYRRTASGRRYLKVVVNYRPVPPQGTWIGEVITSYCPNQPDEREERIQR